mgnify:CR=1 FL=1
MKLNRTRLARRLRGAETGPESVLWAALRDRRLGGWKFRRQVPIDRFVADFACIDAGLTIELDGAHHQDQLVSDQTRRAIIESHGYLELRFTNDEVKERLDWVVQEIRRALDIAQARKPRDAFPRFD